MKTFTMVLCWSLLFIGLCANTKCNPKIHPDDDVLVCHVGETRACDTGLSGVCSSGVQTCKDGQFAACEQSVKSSAEICDGLDNDCDGVANGICSLTISSVPEFDGNHHWWADQGCYEEYRYDEGIKVNQADVYRYYGIVTFDLSNLIVDWTKITSVSLLMYNLDYEAEQPAAVELSYYNVPDEDFSVIGFSGCSCGYGGCAYWGVSSIYDAPSGNLCTPMRSPEQQFDLTLITQGQYETSSSEFTSLFSANSTKQYFTFTLSEIPGTISSDIQFEDGENTGGTGNLPTLLIEYTE